MTKQLRKSVEKLKDLEEELFLRSQAYCRERNEYYVFCDVETTGLDPFRNDIISASFSISDIDHKECDSFDFTAAPINFKFWSPAAEKIHKITEKEAGEYQHPYDACYLLLKWLKPYLNSERTPNRFIYHANRRFDWQFLRAMFIKQDLEYSLYQILNCKNLESTIDLAYKVGFKRGQVSLDKLCKHYGIELQHHDASSDRNACYQLHKIFSSQLLMS